MSVTPSDREPLGFRLKVSTERVTLPNRQEIELDIVRHPGASAVVPFTSDREVLLIVAPVDGDERLHLCGNCGFVVGGPGEPCPRCALINEDVAVAFDGQRVAESVEEWLKDRGEPPKPHPLELELEKIQNVSDAQEECPPLWWADKPLWRGLRWCAIRSLETVH